ncbi:MAG: hypothetical protein GMKNLPBB_01948 [Myxococcota bacterium]|nr:hypothetical protein [Myxococcota bacterium]
MQSPDLIPPVRQRLNRVLVLSACLFAVSVSGGCSKKNSGPDGAAPEKTGLTPLTAPSRVEAPPPPQPKARTTPCLDASSFKNLNLAKLPPDMLKEFGCIAADELCPCDCPASLGVCLANPGMCNRAHRLGRFINVLLENKAAGDQLKEHLTKGFFPTYESKQADLELDNVAFTGPAAADVTIVEFLDFQCPYCRLTFPAIKMAAEQMKGRKVKVVLKHFPLSSHPFSDLFARSFEAAREQKKEWQMAELLFANQDAASPELPVLIAQKLGMNMDKFKSDLQPDGQPAARVERNKLEARRLNLDSTPSIFINNYPFKIGASPDFIQDRAEDILEGDRKCNEAARKIEPPVIGGAAPTAGATPAGGVGP